MTSFERVTPVLRIFDEEKAREFYEGFLGFDVAFAHRFEPETPIYMGLTLGEVYLHLSEHHGDASPGAHIRISMDDVKSFCAELNEKGYKYARPDVEGPMPWGGFEMTIADPFGNRVTFAGS